MSVSPKPVGRLAPSPTGGLHLGHARTFLAAWLSARSRGGRIVLRIEDIDASRVRPEAIQGAIDDLKWLGLDWDEGPDCVGPAGAYIQSQRLTDYEHAIAELKAQEYVYPCNCTRAEIARAASAPHAGDEGPIYPGTCSGRCASDEVFLVDQPFAWRFRVPAGVIAWDDLFLGPIKLDPSQVGGDFVVARNGLGPAYQLAVVVDDASMGVTEVIRGEDLVPSTPRQILLYRALGCPIPTFGHLSLVVDQEGRRLAKRDQSIKLSTLREQGTDPRQLVGRLAVSLGMAQQVEPRTPANWISLFDAGKVPTTTVFVDLETLDSRHRSNQSNRNRSDQRALPSFE